MDRVPIFYTATYRSATQTVVLDECPLIPQVRRDLFARALPIVALPQAGGALTYTSRLLYNWLNKDYVAFVTWWCHGRKVATQGLLKYNSNPILSVGSKNMILDLAAKDTGQDARKLSRVLQLHDDNYRPLSVVIELGGISLETHDEIRGLSIIFAQAWFGAPFRSSQNLADMRAATSLTQ